MEITTRPAITVSERDLERLEAMLAGLPDNQPGVDALREELDRAQIAASEAMPPDGTCALVPESIPGDVGCSRKSLPVALTNCGSTFRLPVPVKPPCTMHCATVLVPPPAFTWLAAVCPAGPLFPQKMQL